MSNEFSVYASLLSAEPEEAENIAAWLADREAEKTEMEKMDIVVTRQDNERLSATSGSFDENVAISQIRILSKQFTAEPDVIPYVAVLDEWEDGMWLVVPFSQYKTPATPGEMATGLTTRGLRVIQAWNGRTVQDSIMKKSYLLAELPDQVRQDALALFRHEFAGTPLPDSFKARRGSVIELEDDPRREYLSESVARLRPLAEAVIAEAEKASQAPCKGGILGSSDEFFKNVFLHSETLPAYGLAAATVDNQKASMLLLEGKDNSLESFVETCVECRLLKPFVSICRMRKPYNMTFAVDVPEQWKTLGEIDVVARNRADGELIGEGKLDTATGRGVIRTRSTNADIDKASQVVLVIAKQQ